GAHERVSWRREGPVTVVPLTFQSSESVFVLFRDRTQSSSEEVAVPQERTLLTIAGDWRLQFESARAAPEGTIIGPRDAWTQSFDAGIRYLAGVGSYRKSLTVSSAQLPREGRVWLDLGDVHELAEVNLNGHPVGSAWHAPFRLDATRFLQTGVNILEVHVA